VRPAVDTQALAREVAEAGLAVILHEDAVTPLRRVLGKWSEGHQEASGPGEILLIVGPEGGISPREVTRLCSAGAVTALLGPHVLRSSTAGPAGVVVASDVLGRW
jgi:16S rRNA (uracil1498-N3)-methyltransferase